MKGKKTNSYDTASICLLMIGIFSFGLFFSLPVASSTNTRFANQLNANDDNFGYTCLPAYLPARPRELWNGSALAPGLTGPDCVEIFRK